MRKFFYPYGKLIDDMILFFILALLLYGSLWALVEVARWTGSVWGWQL